MDITRLCVCEDEEECPIRHLLPPMVNAPEPNQFSNIRSLDELLTAKDTGANPEPHFCKPGYKQMKWERCDCFLFYVFVYDERGGPEEMYKRVREHEIVAPPHKLHHQIPEQLTLRVIPLFEKKQSSHGFVEIYNAKGIGDHGMVVDLLSAIKLEERYAIYFGFLTPSPTNFGQSTRIAVKREKIVQITERRGSIVSEPTSDYYQSQNSQHEAFEKSVDKIRKEIEMVFKVDKPNNMKYLAYTNLEEDSKSIWIALELCRMEIFKDLIEAEMDTRLGLDMKQKKICFSQILQGLTNLHENGIVHGEITPENILLSLDGAELKIGDYDHVKEVQNDREYPTIKDDIIMTARVFLKCLKKDARFDSKKLSNLDHAAAETWISSLDLTEKVENCDMKNYLSNIVEVVFYGGNRESIKVYMERERKLLPRSWTTIFTKLANELIRCACEEPYVSSYLILYMAWNEPQAQEVRMHPFFWDECIKECFVRRVIAYLQNPQSSEAENLRRTLEEKLVADLQVIVYPSPEHGLMPEAEYKNYQRWPELVENNGTLLSIAVCLLHQVVWPKRERMPYNIRPMLLGLSNLDPLSIRKSYYH